MLAEYIDLLNFRGKVINKHLRENQNAHQHSGTLGALSTHYQSTRYSTKFDRKGYSIIALIYPISPGSYLHSKIFDILILPHFVRPDIEVPSLTRIIALSVHLFPERVMLSNIPCNRHSLTRTRLFLKYRPVTI